jgi:hypothetical protein
MCWYDALCQGRPVSETATAALVICSDGCFKQLEFAEPWW